MPWIILAWILVGLFVAPWIGEKLAGAADRVRDIMDPFDPSDGGGFV